MDFDYETLLKKAARELPENITGVDRFQIERVRGHLEGNKTIVSNFKKIVKDMHREPAHALKYLLKELATPGKFDGDRLVFGSKVSASQINKKIRQYAGDYVLCPDCGKPDTMLTKKMGMQNIRCNACGNEHPVKNI